MYVFSLFLTRSHAVDLASALVMGPSVVWTAFFQQRPSVNEST